MTEETHAEFKARMKIVTSATHRPAGVAMPNRMYEKETEAEHYGKRLAVAGYGHEDLRVMTRDCQGGPLSAEAARKIVFGRRW